MISATSPAAKNSPVAAEAIRARETSRSALMSCSKILSSSILQRVKTKEERRKAAVSVGKHGPVAAL